MFLLNYFVGSGVPLPQRYPNSVASAFYVSFFNLILASLAFEMSGGPAQLERRASDRKVAGSMPVLGITSLCPWERHLKQIS